MWSHLKRARETFKSARSPETPAEKVFVPKFKIPVLEDYGAEEYPPEYWEYRHGSIGMAKLPTVGGQGRVLGKSRGSKEALH